MKVLHFKTRYLNQSETFIDRLVRNHQEFSPVIATCYSEYFTENLNVYEMPKSGINGLVNYLQLKFNQSPSFLYDVVEAEKPDIIHGHFGLDSYRLISLSKKAGIPLIVNFYGHDVVRLPREFGWKARYKKLKKQLAWAIAVSDDMKENLIKLGFDKDKVSTIKLAVDVEAIEFKERKKASPKIMMVGRVVEKKGFIYALRAIEVLRDQYPELTFDIYGDGELMPDLKKFVADHKLGNIVTFHGFTDNEDVFKALYEHDILLVPSVQARDGDREGMPQTTVEGLATGIPVVAAAHAGLPELIENKESGLLVEERNPEELAEAICQLIEDPDLVNKVSINGRKRVLEEHNLKTQVSKTEALYRKLIKKM